MIAVELNTAVKNKFFTLGTPYSTIQFTPFSAYEDSSAPFIVYNEYPGTQNEEQYFLLISNVVYVIYDNDASRLKDIGYELRKFLNVGDDVAEIKSLLTVPYYGMSGDSSYRYRITTCRQVAGSTNPPLEREGFASQTFNFRVVYLGKDE